MKRILSLPALIAVLSLGIAMVISPGRTAAAADKRETAVHRLLELSGMDAIMASFMREAVGQMSGRLVVGNDPRGIQVRDMFQAVFATQPIREAVVASLLRDYDEAHARAVLAWFTSDLGQEFLAEEARAQTAEVSEDLIEFGAAMQAQAPNPERFEIAVGINRARMASSLSLQLLTGLMRGMLDAAEILDASGGRSLTPAELDAAVAQQLGSLGPGLETQMIVSYLFSGRNLSIDKNRRYLDFLESDPAQWFYERTNSGLVNAMARAGRAFGSHSSAWSQDFEATRAPDVSTSKLAEAAEAGREFASSNPQKSCIDSVYERRRACQEIACFGYARVYAEACLATAEPDASLCKGVPDFGDLMLTIFWRLGRCEERGTPDAACDAAHGAVQEYCAS